MPMTILSQNSLEIKYWTKEGGGLFLFYLDHVGFEYKYGPGFCFYSIDLPFTAFNFKSLHI